MELDQRWYKVLPGALLCALLWGSAFPCLKTVYGIWEEVGFEPGLGDPVVILITCLALLCVGFRFLSLESSFYEIPCAPIGWLPLSNPALWDGGVIGFHQR